MSWQKSDKEILDWLEEHGHNVHLACWNVFDDHRETDNGWTVECRDTTIGEGVNARMAVSDAIHHPERLREAMKKDEE